MLIYTKTRQQMRDIVSRRKAAGYPAQAKDFGKECAKRYAVILRPEGK